MDIPVIKVGIIADYEISFTLQGEYLIEQLDLVLNGSLRVGIQEAAICIGYGNQSLICPGQINILPVDPQTATFLLSKVTIGVDFHWERQEDQIFKGALSLILIHDKIQVINIINIEDYLLSVISSEMSATSSLEFLKAHAVISRSWLLAQLQKNKILQQGNQQYQASSSTEDELIRWYDREDHLHFDVCADDHCQRYQGITRSVNPQINEAVLKTRGEVLTFGGLICDARFSKCCGGITETFENVWEPVSHPYLQMIIDQDSDQEEFNPDLRREEEAVTWIMGKPDVFCNTSDKKVLQQVLNEYDQETNDFFRWKVIYSQTELSELVKSRTGIDFGTINDLIPVERGVSGRLLKLKIVGTLRTMTIGKELEIRKSLSKSHLLSSAFTLTKQQISNNVNFILHGAGWGHGVGLCQIGAAVMGDKGYRYPEILTHYFSGAESERIY